MRALALLVLGVACLGFTVSRAAETSEETFLRANAAYEAKDYDEAAEAYESLVRYRIRDPRLEYNLANAEFRRGNLGPAILHYQRAHRLDPTDEDIQANLEYAVSLAVDQIPEEQAAAVIQWIRGVQDSLGPDYQAWTGLVLAWLTAILISWGLARPGRWSPAYGWGLAVLLLAIAITAGSWSVTYERLEGRKLAVILEPAVEVLAGPGMNNATLFTIHEGLSVQIRSDDRGEWVQVSLPNGLNGWIPASTIGIV